MAVGRITGYAMRVERRQGTARTSGNPYDITTAKIVVADEDVTEVTYSTQNDSGIRIQKGDFVDLLVDLGVYNGDVACRVLRDFPEDEVPSARAA